MRGIVFQETNGRGEDREDYGLHIRRRRRHLHHPCSDLTVDVVLRRLRGRDLVVVVEVARAGFRPAAGKGSRLWSCHPGDWQGTS